MPLCITLMRREHGTREPRAQGQAGSSPDPTRPVHRERERCLAGPVGFLPLRGGPAPGSRGGPGPERDLDLRHLCKPPRTGLRDRRDSGARGWLPWGGRAHAGLYGASRRRPGRSHLGGTGGQQPRVRREVPLATRRRTLGFRRRRDRRGDTDPVRRGSLRHPLAPPLDQRLPGRRHSRRRHARVLARAFRSRDPPRRRTRPKRLLHAATLRRIQARCRSGASRVSFYESPDAGGGAASARASAHAHRISLAPTRLLLPYEADAAGVRTPVVAADHVLDLAARLQVGGVALDLGVVHEQVVAGRSYQEPVALFGIEPLHPSLLPVRFGARRLCRCLRRCLRSLRRGCDGEARGLRQATTILGLVALSVLGGERWGALGHLQDYRIFGHLHDDRLDAGPVLFPDRVIRHRRVEPHTPAVLLAVVEDALEDAHRFVGGPVATVDVVAGAERLHGRGAGTQGVRDPLVRLALVYPLPYPLYVRLESNALLRICHTPDNSSLALIYICPNLYRS